MMTDAFLPLLENIEEKKYRYYSGTKWVNTSTGKTIAIHSPIDQSLVGEVSALSKEEAERVITNAHNKQPLWEQTTIHERIAIVQKAAEFLRKNVDAYTEMLILEIGKTKEESKKEVLRTADLIDFCTTEVISVKGEQIESDAFPGFKKGITSLVEHVAHGVVLAIGPFNYPINLVASKIAPALLMGNAVVVKPPTQGSISGLMLTQAFVHAGVPDGIISCVTGSGKEIGDCLVMHPNVSMIAFTGSSPVGISLAKKAGMKPLLFECGGNNSVIVLNDADMNLAASEIVKGGYAYSGQRCTGIKYVLAQQGVIDRLIPGVVEQIQMLVHLGDPRKEETKLMGPVISLQSAEEIIQIVNEAVTQGAEIITGGTQQNGYVQPTVLKNVQPNMKVVFEETFGPVVSFISVTSTQQAIDIINASQFGLQASIFTADEGSGMAISKQLQVGTVQLNGSPQRGPDHFPFMGVKASGLGTQGIRYSLEAMSRLKSVVINNPQ